MAASDCEVSRITKGSDMNEWPIENTEHAIAMEQSRSTAISLNNQVCELQKSIEQGNRANARAQAIEIDRLRDENARLRESLQKISDGDTDKAPGTYGLADIIQDHYRIAREALKAAQ
jgi:hypothetical protein